MENIILDKISLNECLRYVEMIKCMLSFFVGLLIIFFVVFYVVMNGNDIVNIYNS